MKNKKTGCLLNRLFYKFFQPIQPVDCRIIESVRIMLLNIADIRINIQRSVKDMLCLA